MKLTIKSKLFLILMLHVACIGSMQAEVSAVYSIVSNFQQNRGRVVDVEGTGIARVTVRNQRSLQSTQTDQDGLFQLLMGTLTGALGLLFATPILVAIVNFVNEIYVKRALKQETAGEMIEEIEKAAED